MCGQHRVIWIDVAGILGSLLNSVHFLLTPLLIQRAYNDRLSEVHVPSAAQLDLPRYQ